jgi:hypothetical protein
MIRGEALRHHVARSVAPFSEWFCKTVTKLFEPSSPRFHQHTRLDRHNRQTRVVYSDQERTIAMSSTLNVVQMEANRRNAEKSSGPRTEAGKKISSLNALRHGLTSRVVVLPSEDLSAYKKFSDEFLASLAPETFPETQCAQTIIDTQWRLNRVRSLEEGMLALGHNTPAGEIDYGHPEIHAALTAASVFLEHSQAFVNLSMHEQRLYRIMAAAQKSLDEMKARRIAARRTELDAAVALYNLNKMLGEPNDSAFVGTTAGFVFKPEEIDTESRRHRLLLEAKIAQQCGYDRKKFRQRQAAQ